LSISVFYWRVASHDVTNLLNKLFVSQTKAICVFLLNFLHFNMLQRVGTSPSQTAVTS
jgi:hypothetical protein